MVAQQTIPNAARRDDRFLLSGVSWETYERLLDDLDTAGRRVKLTYDTGELELEMPLDLHEIIKTLICGILEMYLLEHADFSPYGETTFKRRLTEKGIEPDGCYYVQSIGKIGVRLDPERDPPPDLAIEVEVTQPILPKLPIYAAIGIPEIWHASDDLTVRFLRLNGGEYHEASTSEAAPLFTPEIVTKYLRMRMTSTHGRTLQAFRRDELRAG